MSQKDVLIGWLNDAYAMEKNQINVLERQVKHAEEHPQIKQRLESHLAETRRHAEMVEQCVERLGGSTSAAKTAMAQLSGFMESVTTGSAQDTLVKDCLADYSMEHMEIGSYKALIAGAEAAGENEVADVCRQVLRDEENMAGWLEEQLVPMAQTHVRGQETSA